MGNPNGVPANGIPNEVEAVTAALSAPFDLAEVQFKPAVISGNRAAGSGLRRCPQHSGPARRCSRHRWLAR